MPRGGAGARHSEVSTGYAYQKVRRVPFADGGDGNGLLSDVCGFDWTEPRSCFT